jgi:hypothetical protein
MDQKQADFREALHSRRYSDLASKQNDRILVFTLVTVIFVSTALQKVSDTSPD